MVLLLNALSQHFSVATLAREYDREGFEEREFGFVLTKETGPRSGGEEKIRLFVCETSVLKKLAPDLRDGDAAAGVPALLGAAAEQRGVDFMALCNAIRRDWERRDKHRKDQELQQGLQWSRNLEIRIRKLRETAYTKAGGNPLPEGTELALERERDGVGDAQAIKLMRILEPGSEEGEEMREYGYVDWTAPLFQELWRDLGRAMSEDAVRKVRISAVGNGRTCRAQVLPPAEEGRKATKDDLATLNAGALGGIKPAFDMQPNWKRWQTLVEMAHLFKGHSNKVVWTIKLCAPRAKPAE